MQCWGIEKRLEFEYSCGDAQAAGPAGPARAQPTAADGSSASTAAASGARRAKAGIVAVLLPGHSWEHGASTQARQAVAAVAPLADALLVLGQPLPGAPASLPPLIDHDIEWSGDAAAALNEAAALVAEQRPAARWLLTLRADEDVAASGADALLAQLESNPAAMLLCADKQRDTARVRKRASSCGLLLRLVADPACFSHPLLEPPPN